MESDFLDRGGFVNCGQNLRACLVLYPYLWCREVRQLFRTLVAHRLLRRPGHLGRGQVVHGLSEARRMPWQANMAYSSCSRLAVTWVWVHSSHFFKMDHTHALGFPRLPSPVPFLNHYKNECIQVYNVC